MDVARGNSRRGGSTSELLRCVTTRPRRRFGKGRFDDESAMEPMPTEFQEYETNQEHDLT
jgi:hypothetical protein